MSVRPAIPFATSLTEPSPPTTTSSFAPPSAAWRASDPSSPCRWEKSVSPSSPRCAARCAISGQRLPVAPLLDAGLTRKTVSLMGCRREGDACHPVDCGLHLVVGDPLELTLDDDVADDEEAAGLHASERADGEERGGLHLDGEHTALRPALVLSLVRVVEEVARDDRTDVHRLAHLLRHVNRAMDQL